jgi:hypothetical protein
LLRLVEGLKVPEPLRVCRDEAVWDGERLRVAVELAEGGLIVAELIVQEPPEAVRVCVGDTLRETVSCPEEVAVREMLEVVVGVVVGGGGLWVNDWEKDRLRAKSLPVARVLGQYLTMPSENPSFSNNYDCLCNYVIKPLLSETKFR